MRRTLALVFVMLACATVVAADIAVPVASPVDGELRLPGVIGSHMVLQRDVAPVIWGWGAKGADVTAALDGDNKGTATVDGTGAWRVKLKAVKADGKAHKLVVTQDAHEGRQTIGLEDILIGDVWLGSGQSNMEWPLSRTEARGEAIQGADDPRIRLFHVPRARQATPAGDVTAVWRVCSPQTVPAFSGVLYHFGKRIHRDLDVPVGLINAAWGGSAIEPWIVTDSASGGMYNGMIAPLVSFRIRGAVWYQGEANAMQRNGFAYFGKMKDLIEGWRHAWGYEFPFYFVQLAPWSGTYYAPGQLPALWEGQVAALKIPKTGMAVTTDTVHDLKDIHPPNKRDVGERLALWALVKTYGKDLVYSGPLYKSMSVEGNKIRIFFAHTGGGLMSSDGRPLNEFQVAGADGNFVPAKAVIDGETVVLEAEAVAAPTQARFGWHNTAVPNLANKEGLPASPFRTEGWRGGTGE